MNLDELRAKGNRLRQEVEVKFNEIVAEIKRQEAAGPSPEIRRLARELHKLRAQLSQIIKQLQEAAGIDEADLEAIERAALPRGDDRWWRYQIVETPSSEYLDDFTPKAIRALLERVDSRWLRDQAACQYRLDDNFLSAPLHLVGGVRIPPPNSAAVPQRFAHMLLVSIDHFEKRDDLDFFSAATFVPELTVLGHRLPMLPTLGLEAIRKFEGLPFAPNDEVPSIIHELLVGTACAAKGLKVEMLASSGSGKSPDFRVRGLGVPAVIECKRRHGLSRYELDEAIAVEALYSALQPFARQAALHGALEVRFRVPINRVEPSSFIQPIRAVLNQTTDLEPIATIWGEFAYRRLPLVGTVPYTRLYSPDFLQRVFGWSPADNDWDGLLCEVEPPTHILVRGFRLPFCLKWRSESPEALTKKARGVTSLWARAARQIPAGEFGFIYIAYPEGQRGKLADARTGYIIASSKEFWHRWSVHIPVTIIGRLYARPLGVGVPDLIENSLLLVSPGEEHWLADLPSLVFLVTVQ